MQAVWFGKLFCGCFDSLKVIATRPWLFTVVSKPKTAIITKYLAKGFLKLFSFVFFFFFLLFIYLFTYIILCFALVGHFYIYTTHLICKVFVPSTLLHCTMPKTYIACKNLVPYYAVSLHLHHVLYAIKLWVLLTMANLS